MQSFTKKYCKENLPSEADDIFKKADEYYREFMRRDMPDLGKNMMATNMYDWFTIVSFYEASGHRLDGEVLLTIKRDAAEKMKFLGKIVNGNKSNWPYKLFEKTYVKFNRMQKEHQAKGEWMDSWKVEINPDGRTEGFCFHLIGCPIAKHAKEHGYADLLPYLCRTDHYLAEVMHARLIRTQIEALGGDCLATTGMSAMRVPHWSSIRILRRYNYRSNQSSTSTCSRFSSECSISLEYL